VRFVPGVVTAVLPWLIIEYFYGSEIVMLPVMVHIKLKTNIRNLLWSSIIVSTSRIISLYRRCASAAICSTELLRVSKTPVG
jgi:hypothetical protein